MSAHDLLQRDHLAASRDMLIVLADPIRQDLVQLFARDELNVGEIAERVTLSSSDRFAPLEFAAPRRPVPVWKQGRETYYRLNKEPTVAALQGLPDSLTCC